MVVQSEASLLLVLVEKLPSSHGSGAEAPAGQYEPCEQGTHSVAPDALWYVPGSQSEQTEAPCVFATLPGKQSVQTAGSELPGMGLAVPTAHGVQSSEVLEPCWVL